MPNRFALVIFDCDGVLVDSESLGIRVLIECGREYGLQMGLTEGIPLFLGRKMADCVALISERIGHPLPDDFTPNFRARLADVFRRELKAVPGVREALAQITTPVCIASNGPREKMMVSLEVTELYSRFDPHIFTAYEVGSWKPEPGLYLHAAAAFGVDPADCAVIEDSPLGVQAAVAAGMTPFGYAPDPHHAPALAALGATIFSDMKDLPALLETT